MKTKRYRSPLEKRLHKGPLKGWAFEDEKIQYIVPHYYLPDFVLRNMVVEAKGFFRVGDAQKYMAIRAQLEEEGRELVFCFSNPKTPMPGAKRRMKTGTKYSMGEWADRQGIRHFTEHNIHELAKELKDEEHEAS